MLALNTRSRPDHRMTSFVKHRFHVLDGMRGIAAILVMLFHYNSRWHLPFLKNTYLAVDFFFILSGFVICHSYGEKILGGMSPADYIARRVARLFPMMALGLLIGLPAFYFLTLSGHSDYTRREMAVATVNNLFFVPYLNQKKLFFDGQSQAGVIFPTDNPLWSIFFELVVSVAFIALIRARRLQVGRLCAGLLVLLLITSMAGGFDENWLGLQTPQGWNTENFLSGFPRVFYGFTCGMLIYFLRSAPSPYAWINRFQKIPAVHVLWLYAVLAAILLFPFQLRGLYYFATVALLAPLLVIQGGKAECRNTILLSASEFLGWLSYPVYCLHAPVINALHALDEHVFSARFGLYCNGAAVVCTLLLASLSAFIFDRLKVQPVLGNFLRRLFSIW
jgi:peptidoglycan/LPS O-acetylase OafA/YrhL